MPLTVAIIGRPNVGKSTLFNRLVGKKAALVDDQPGVTRDRRYGEGSLAGLSFTIVDTAGLEEADPGSLEAGMRAQTDRAVDEADLVLMLVDARAGITPLDRHFANWLRQTGKPVALLANKAESKAAEAGMYEAYELGLGEPIAFSGAHGEGTADLAQILQHHAGLKEASEAREERRRKEKPLQLAIVGRPNVGKSTLVNALLGDERMLTGPTPGVTRDAIANDWTYQDRPIRLVDTAGLRRKSRIDERVEQMSVGNTLATIRMAEIVLLVLDADAVLDKQDLTIARHVIEEGRALVIAVNKWDSVEDEKGALQRLSDRLQTSLPQVRGVPTVTISALKRRRLDKMMDAILAADAVWNTRVSTGQLNRWLAEMIGDHPPPLVQGRRFKLKYMTQVKARPPTFAVFTSSADELPEDYNRYLVNGLRKRFRMEGVPIRIALRKQRNPYEGRKKKR